MSDVLQSLSLWRASESALESSVPLIAAGTAWYVLYKAAASPAVGRPLTPLELAVLLGSCVALTAWSSSRQLHIAGRRSPRASVFSALLFNALALLSVRPLIDLRFVRVCTETLGGELAHLSDLAGEPVKSVCHVNGVAGNAYLAGTVIPPSWSGDLSLPLVLFLGAVSVLGALGLRDRRLRPTRIPGKLYDRLRLAPASGSAGVPSGPAPVGGQVQACANPTLWGETCGQIYALEKVFQPNEWCHRCQQTYRRADRALRFTVVSLFTADVDVLNGLERLDTVSWRRGEPMPPDARISGQERWVTLGELELPDVITVAQALALAHEALATWAASEDAAVAEAAKLAQQRASRICGWIWFGRHADRLTYARPTSRARFAVGPTRLKELVGDSGEALVLQLDIGLLPLELRVGFRKTFLDRRRAPELQNSKQDLWIPVGPSAPPPGGAGPVGGQDRGRGAEDVAVHGAPAAR